MIATKKIYSCFDCLFPEQMLKAWADTDIGSLGVQAIDISNCYFKPVAESCGIESKDFSPTVDPQGRLCGMAKGDGISSYLHTEDNQVQYFTTSCIENGTRRYAHAHHVGTLQIITIVWLYTPCGPQSFHSGDIVQAQMSFVMIPVRGGCHKMLTVLRSLALVNSSFVAVSILSLGCEWGN